ncbi:MAG: hypothetical protein LBD48_10590 [Treponema sp.]|nr:hypothetical protein [Treponema sp.]
MGMCCRGLNRAILILISLILLAGCGELDSLFSSNGTYQVQVLVNGSSLEDCALIRAEDQIRPYFTSSVTKDPDLTGLRLFLQNTRGEVTGSRIYSILQTYEDQIDSRSEAAASDTDTEDSRGEAPAEAADTVAEGFTGVGQMPAAALPGAEEPAGNVVVVKSLASSLPWFTIPAGLEIGPYTLVLQAMGGREILDRTELNLFYLGGAQFSFRDIQAYLPGVSSGSRLLPPGIAVMLEAHVDFDARLDPYIIWYNGKNIIAEGKLSEGAGRFLWKAPEQTGFHSVRAEAFPYYPNNRIAGSSREMAMPVSAKAADIGYFFGETPAFIAPAVETEGIQPVPEESGAVAAVVAAAEIVMPPAPPELLHWYQFSGNLKDSKNPMSTERALIPVSEKTSRWMPAGNSYGLLVDSETFYMLPAAAFVRKTAVSGAEVETGGGQFLLHIKPLSEGKIFSALFGLRSGSEAAEISLSKTGNDLILTLSAPDASSVKMPLTLTAGESDSYLTVVVNFFIRPYRLEASFGVGENLLRKSKAQSIQLPAPLKGEGRLILGGRLPEAGTRSGQTDTAEVAPVTAMAEIPAGLSGAAAEADPLSLETVQPEEFPAADIGPDAAFSGAADPPPAVEEQVFLAGAVWDEFAVLYSAIPLIAERLLPEPEEKEEKAAEWTVKTEAVAAAEPESAVVELSTEISNMEETEIPALEPLAEDVSSTEKKTILTNEGGADETESFALQWKLLPPPEPDNSFSVPANPEAVDSGLLNERELFSRTSD